MARKRPKYSRSSRQVLLDRRPEMVLIYGDTNTTLAGALAAAKLHVPVAHVEAGLRSFNRRMPEEVNRIVADSLADVLFAPTQTAIENLCRENVDPEKIHLVGDVMQDAAQRFAGPARKSKIHQVITAAPGAYALVTVHRAENTDDVTRLSCIVESLLEIAASMPVVMPLHPRTKHALMALGWYEKLAASVEIIEPQGYLAMLALESDARLIITDSGGVQKEAYFQKSSLRDLARRNGMGRTDRGRLESTCSANE